MERLSGPDRAAPAVDAFARGAAVVAALGADGRPAGLLCRSFASLSLEPPLVLLCVDGDAAGWPAVRAAGRFAVSILAEEQRALGEALDGPAAPGTDPFAGFGWQACAAGAVRVLGALATADCLLDTVHETGDHHLVTARVLALAAREGGSPLLSFRSDYVTGAFG
ncbi:flavin reductase family protein [Streptomyces sp. NPDC029003]|uniref:flavin reductase family protein n=1 Tax=Streptomyces sp. NPDC029003 TaxID=3155125 RepID=UPI0033C2A59F